MNKFLFFSILFLCIFRINAQSISYNTLKTKEDCKKLSATVANLFYEDSIVKAVTKMRDYWPIEEDEIEAFQEKSLKSLNIIENLYGYRISVIKVKEEMLENFALRETYILRYEKSAIKLTFKYFDTTHGWILNAFKWDDEYSSEFK